MPLGISINVMAGKRCLGNTLVGRQRECREPDPLARRDGTRLPIRVRGYRLPSAMPQAKSEMIRKLT